jgi:hypothetical protein
MTRHLADRPRVVSLIGEPGYNLRPSVSSVVPGFTLARTNASIEAAELSGMTARRMRPDRVSRYFVRFRLGLAWLVPRSITSTAPAMRIFPDWRDRKNCCRPGKEPRLGRTRPRPPAARAGDRSPQLLRQQPGGLVCDAELGLELECRHAIGVGCHKMRGPEPHCQRQFGPVHNCASRNRRLTTATESVIPAKLLKKLTRWWREVDSNFRFRAAGLR